MQCKVISFDLYLFFWLFPPPLIYRTQSAVILHVITAAQASHVAPELLPPSAQSALTTHASCAAPPRLHPVSPALQESFLLPAAPQHQWGGGWWQRPEVRSPFFKHLWSLHFDRFIKTLSNVQNKLSGLENSIKDISSRHDSKVGFYAFKVLPAF